MLRKTQKQKTSGAALTLELIFILTCLMCLLVIGWASLSAKVLAEISDIGNAVGSLDQSFRTNGMAVGHNGTAHPPTANGGIAFWAGSQYTDNEDFCDAGCDCGVVMCIPPSGVEVHAQ